MAQDKLESALNREYDCVIVGGGPAGLSAAIYMGRMRRSVIVIDGEEGRSTWHQINHNYLGFPDGVHATALREIGQEQAERYGAVFVEAFAKEARVEGKGRERRFYVETSRGTVTARTIIIATGVHDKFPEFEGSDECIGKSMFWCIICDGYEAIDKRIVVLGSGSRAANLALEVLNFTRDVSLVSWDGPFRTDPERQAVMKEHGITLYDSSCVSYNCATTGYLCDLELEDGTKIDLDMLFVAQDMEPNTHLAKQLKMKLGDDGFIAADAEQSTNIEGAYAAGDITHLFNHQVSSAVHEGGMAAAAANYYLYEDWQKEN